MLVTENTSALRVISVWGSGGDVASIIKEAYDKQRICQKFRRRAWLKLARPFNPHEFVRNLADQDYGMEQETQDADPVKKFVGQIKAETYLVVLEDLSSMAEWHVVRAYLPESKNGSLIVVSTEQLEIARLCAGQPYQVLQLRKLSDNHSVCVFFNKGFKRVEVGKVVGGQFLLETAKHSVQDDFRLIGRDGEMDKLFKLVSSAGHSDKHHVISLRGFPGVGKSALVRSFLYQNVVDRKLPFEWYGWVDVSHPFNLGDFCRRMLSSHSELDKAYKLQPAQDEGALW